MRLFLKPGLVSFFTAIFTISILSKDFVFAKGNGRIRFAFAGIKFENIRPESGEKIIEDIISVISSKPQIELLKPDDVKNLIGEERINLILTDFKPDSVFAVAKLLDVDYILVGYLANKSQDPEHIFIVGKIYRFDISSHRYYTLDVEQVYSQFYEVVNAIESQFINSVLPKKTTLRILPVVIIFALIFAGVLALVLSSGKTSNPEEPITSQPL